MDYGLFLAALVTFSSESNFTRMRRRYYLFGFRDTWRAESSGKRRRQRVSSLSGSFFRTVILDMDGTNSIIIEPFGLMFLCYRDKVDLLLN